MIINGKPRNYDIMNDFKQLKFVRNSFPKPNDVRLQNNKIEQETHQKKINELQLQLKKIEPEIRSLEETQINLRNSLEAKNKQFNEIKKTNSDDINQKNFLINRINKLIPIK